ncbi:MAG: trypsin-like peptidase domain-containing protein [Planctomycetes bacterium]|nr:trypsin-like peptidase domain-containing protein [Planctomycetota bacterium]
MQSILRLAFAASFVLPLGLFAQTPTSAPPPKLPTAVALQRDTIALAKDVWPAIVTVRTFVRSDAMAKAAPTPAPTADASGWIANPTHERDYPGFRPHASGSGFFVAKDEILTGLQPLRVAPEQAVDLVEVETVDNQRILCDVVGVEPTLQLAVLRLAVLPSYVPPEVRALPFGDSDALEVGSLVLGAGDPSGPERWMGLGLLVAKPSRDCYQEMMNATYMQATMVVHPGAFGGPLVGLDGTVVGLLHPLQVEGGTTLGSAWALPSKLLVGLYESIRAAGTERSPWLGFSVMSRTEIAKVHGLQAFQKMVKPPHGILLENVFQPSPAAAAGLQVGDFLTHFAGVEIHAPVEFQRQLYLAGVGRTVTLQFFRAGTTFTKDLAIEARPAAAKPR